jgi:hypothetical protein
MPGAFGRFGRKRYLRTISLNHHNNARKRAHYNASVPPRLRYWWIAPAAAFLVILIGEAVTNAVGPAYGIWVFLCFVGGAIYVFARLVKFLWTSR